MVPCNETVKGLRAGRTASDACGALNLVGLASARTHGKTASRLKLLVSFSMATETLCFGERRLCTPAAPGVESATCGIHRPAV